MILPTKHLRIDRSLIYVSYEVLELLGRRTTVSGLWMQIQVRHRAEGRAGEVTFDWFVLALDLLFMLELVEERNGFLVRINKNDSQNI